MQDISISRPKSNSLLYYLVPLLLFAAMAAILYPFYRYRIVSDDISYLTIAQRYLKGDYATAINAYWSPLNVWLLVLLVKITSWPLLLASYLLNCTSFAALLLVSIGLCRKFLSAPWELLGFGLCSAFFWAANIPVTHFADALNTFLLLLCLQLVLRKDFTEKKIWWLVYALLAAVAYFSKAYSFYILPLTTALLLFMLQRHQRHFSMKKAAFIWCCLTSGMLLFSMPWLYLLHQKYGIWTISTAGGVNTNWAIRGYIYFSDQYPVVIPPAYPGSLSCWEDMWINHGTMLSPLGSPSLFMKQLLRMILNVLQWFKVVSEFSPFYFPAWVLGLLYLMRYKIKDYDRGLAAIIIAFLVFPAGYLLLSFGTRYLWFTVPLVMMSGLIFSRQYLQPVVKPGLYHFFLLLYFLSWWPGAVYELKDSLNEGKSDYEVAQQLQELQIKGSFITNNYDDYQNHFRISWFSGNEFYMHFGDNWTTAVLLQEAERLGVKYYFYFYKGNNDDYRLNGASGKQYPEVTGGKIPGLKVFQLK